MKKMKQIAFILVLALSLTTFAACGKNNKDMNAVEDARDAIRDTGEDMKNAITGDDVTNADNADNNGR